MSLNAKLYAASLTLLQVLRSRAILVEEARNVGREGGSWQSREKESFVCGGRALDRIEQENKEEVALSTQKHTTDLSLGWSSGTRKERDLERDWAWWLAQLLLLLTHVETEPRLALAVVRRRAFWPELSGADWAAGVASWCACVCVWVRA